MENSLQKQAIDSLSSKVQNLEYDLINSESLNKNLKDVN